MTCFQTKKSIDYYSVFSWMLVLIGFGGFLLWAVWAPLDQGVSTEGVVIVNGQRKSVQPSFNGIVKQVLVNEGDHVKQGQPLIELDTSVLQQEIAAARQTLYMALASQARLQAEGAQRLENITVLTHKDTITESGHRSISPLAFPRQLMAAADVFSQAQTAITRQQRLFDSRRRMLTHQYDNLKEHLASVISQRLGEQSVLNNQQVRSQQMLERIRAYEKLAIKGFISQNTLFELRDQRQVLLGQIASTQSRLTQIRHDITKAELAIHQHSANHRQAIQEELAQLTVDIPRHQERLAKLAFQSDHSVIKASVSGYVMDLTVLTHGSVLQQGQTILALLPSEQALQVDVQLPLQMVDSISPDSPVDLLFTSLNQLKTPKIQGRVVRIAPDRLTDERTGQPYYATRVAIDPDEFDTLNTLHIKAGMPVQAFIRRGERSLMNYLLKPLSDRIPTAFADP